MRSPTLIYLDYAATTPVDPRVVKTMLPYFTKKFGNTASLHSFGLEAKEAVEKGRKIIADAIKASVKEIYFTSSASESNNLALKGLAWANKDKKHIIISSVEHDCVLTSAAWLEQQGWSLTLLPVDKYGLVDPKEVQKAIRPDTLAVSVMHANNEIGTVNPIGEIGKICRDKGVYFHTDAAQTFGKIPIDVNRLNIDLLTASAHKMCGPKGVAMLYVRSGVRIRPLLHGGGHEGGLRSSTLNVPAIVGFAEGVKICLAEMKKESARLGKLRDKLIKGALTKISDSHLNGHPKKRLPNNANFRFSYIEGEALIMMLDNLGIAASTASACSSPKLQPSHVLLACGLRPQDAHGSLRLSLGRWTTESEIDKVLEVLPAVVEKLRKISPFSSINN
ncbi:cysteine desulfurase NifS [Candidatus Falkowbacteria bacterium CG10_big_fil_rev_8_21_14_0_10_44_15]|uniref:cysteine desulfurase n=1 Tax=Candidatus Falkowbacteria bacterium CG10_big_fil_rev_8_21_14_0_10_44_15 TaxID=1974569 RepID=A0A2H0V1B5_9BACT|nr:MAG: cysteine desulfurase NifS [Candidatus Falkowbacteria bacterium CG10_big_fil_rev_8_21_14_0_10_44_15]